ncbi:cytochrome c1 [Betaproteobacteria bacterium]|nr:cytochrome c1 [Betaproteobacteria bacterium]GHU42300.1 cytochrome c1 [Betaproteobacteria bacterium]
MKTMRNLKTLLAALLIAPALALASEGVHLDRAPDVSGDKAALQNGAKLFVNYCLSCHGASALRYNRLLDLGLTEQQVIDNLMFTTDRIGDQMTVALRPADAKKWFGVVPPDLSIIARARASADGSGADWLYTYLRSFYRDETRPTGWNNVIFPNVGMPHILFELQGEQVLKTEKSQHDGKEVEEHKLALTPNTGSLSAEEYDKQVADLVGFLVWMSDPEAGFRKQLGVGVLLFLAVLFVFAYALKKEFWKDVH